MRGRGTIVCLMSVVVAAAPVCAWAQQENDGLTAAQVLQAIDSGKRYLVGRQADDGSWRATTTTQFRFPVGVTALTLLSLLNSGMTLKDETVKKALKYLRNVREPEPEFHYEQALMIMAFEAANDGQRDKLTIQRLATQLEEGQFKNGIHAGSWGYTKGRKVTRTADRSNAQYAILGLYAAVQAGAKVNKIVWERARKHWVESQNADGGWGYRAQGKVGAVRQTPSTGSMTAAGLASMVMIESVLQREKNEETPDGEPMCCVPYEKDDAIERGLAWMGQHFSPSRNPGNQQRILYYLYGVERAGRLTARRFFGSHDWYRSGAKFLVNKQQRGRHLGAWSGIGVLEKDFVVGTSFSLLFLSKGLSPVLIQKAMYGQPDGKNKVLGDNWNKHRGDIKNLVEHISGRPKWPRLVTWQVLDLNKAVKANALDELRQSPILYLSGKDGHDFTDLDAAVLRAYVDQGNFVLAVANCNNKAGFDASFRELVGKMYPEGDASLKPLVADHVVYRSEYFLKAKDFPLEGVDVGCRTAIMYCPWDASCLWEKLTKFTPENRSKTLQRRVDAGMQLGVNIVAYATGREPPNKLRVDEKPTDQGAQDQIERGFLQIAKLRHSGGWDVAPRALKNLLMGLNRTVGKSATTKPRILDPEDKNLFNYPLIYMHGRNGFQMGRPQVEQLRTHLQRGGVLFADACCGAKAFDSSFRKMAAEIFPGKPLKRIPVSHEIFSSKTFHDLRGVRRRMTAGQDPNAPIEEMVKRVEPFLEGIEIDGRLAMIYSKYDISCALERQASAACAGYIPEDALRIAVNVVMYALLQDASYDRVMNAER